MNQSQNFLFPFILDILSHKPLFAATLDTLFKDLRKKLQAKGVNISNLKKELAAAIDLGKGLGIFTMQYEEVRMPQLKGVKAVVWPLVDNKINASRGMGRSKSAHERSSSKQSNRTKRLTRHKQRFENDKYRSGSRLPKRSSINLKHKQNVKKRRYRR